MFIVNTDAELGADWIAASEALELACRTFVSRHDASEFIIRRTGADRIRSWCSQMHILNTENDEDERAHVDCLISCEFWQQFERTQIRQLEDWVSGDFEFRTIGHYDEVDRVRLVATRFSKTDLLKELPKAPADWMSASAALALVRERNGSGDAAISIARRAHAGLVRTRARLFSQDVPRDFGSKEQLNREHVELPREFWWAEGHEALEADWAAGDFSTWIENTYHWQAFSIEFDRNGIGAMLVAKPIFAAAEQVTHPKTNVARNGKSRILSHDHPYAAARTALALDKLSTEQRNRLTGPSVGAEMVPHYKAKSDGSKVPHNDSLDEYGKSVLAALRDFWADSKS